MQFVFISLDGFIFTSKFGTKKPNIGLKDYFLLVVMFFLANVCNNYAFNFNIPMPLHMIFRAGSLIANMIMGVIILKKRYTISKYVSVLMITFGIVLCTFVSGKEVKATGPSPPPSSPSEDLFWWTLGIALLTIALFVSARMGIYQEVLYGRYGKHPKEALFYTPCCGCCGQSTNASSSAGNHDAKDGSLPGWQCPHTALPLLTDYHVSKVIRYLCISSVYVLTTECSSLTVTLVVTLRKFVSLLFSIVYFQNPFTLVHWIGTLLVFTGTAIFTELVQKIQDLVFTKTKSEKDISRHKKVN
ncbi:hypothetical protein B566_EDAN009841 [Ephemera danica]|nr:hypothetical protein B566_EDAN009841 [Ephemera danica]